MFDSDAATIPVKIAHVAEPKRYPVEQIEQCCSIEMSSPYEKDNPFWKEGEDATTKRLKPHDLFRTLLGPRRWPHQLWTSPFGQSPADGRHGQAQDELISGASPHAHYRTLIVLGERFCFKNNLLGACIRSSNILPGVELDNFRYL